LDCPTAQHGQSRLADVAALRQGQTAAKLYMTIPLTDPFPPLAEGKRRAIHCNRQVAAEQIRMGAKHNASGSGRNMSDRTLFSSVAATSIELAVRGCRSHAPGGQLTRR
jgi:hypothetical protein